jgi:hypothetical protein
LIEEFPGWLVSCQLYLSDFNIPLNDGQEVIKVMRDAAGQHS